MSKKVRRNNYLPYYAPYLYAGGGFFSGLKNGMGSFNASSLGEGLGSSIGAIGSAAGGVVGGLISNGLESTAGNVFNTIGDIGSAIPGPWGAAIGGGAKIVGGLVNAAFGTKVDQEALNRANQGTDYLSSFTSNASSFDDIEGPLAQAGVEEVYKGGWASGRKARKKNEELKRRRQEATEYADRSVGNNIDVLVDEQMDNLLANYAAFGGPLNFGLFPVEGAIDYELAQRRLAQKDLELKKALGGPLHTHGADWTNGITIIGNGGSHESNPLEGVPMGMAPDGEPNLVEEGEVIFGDYVFSNRLHVPKAVREKYKLRGTKKMTFAEAAKKAQKESEERPNDPISQRGLEDIMNKLMVEQETLRQKRQDRKYAEGGDIHIKPSKRGTFTAAASKHDMGVQEFASKVLANPDNYSSAMRKKAQFAKNASKWKHAYGGIMGHHFAGTGDTPNILGLLDGVDYDSQDYGTLATPLTADQLQAIIDNNVDVKDVPLTGTSKDMDTAIAKAVKDKGNGTGTKTSWLSGLRYVPALGAGLGVFSDLMGWTNKPDYSGPQSVINAANSIGDVHYTPIGDYLSYTPLDRLFYANQLRAQAGATRRNIVNTSGGNRGAAMAGLLATDYNAQGQLGNLSRQAEEYNLGQRERVATFNRGTNMFNAENNLKAQIANRENAKIKVDAAVRAAAMRDAIDQRVGAAKSANLTNLFDSLGDIGREAFTMDMIRNNRGLLYDWMGRYKGGTSDTDSKGTAHGGLLTIKKKRRR